MPRPVRRVVTGHDGNGKAVVVMDGSAPNVVTSRHRPGARTNLWRTISMPASIEGERDEAAAEMKFALEPLANGTNFRISEYPLETETDAGIDGEKAFAEVGAAHRIVKGARHPFMVVQRGANHAWASRSDKLCRFILIDAADRGGCGPS